MTATTILPGARIRGRAGIIGVVERVELDAEHHAPGSLLTRSDDGTRHYRFPLSLVTGVVDEADNAIIYTVVQLDLDPDDLARYIAQDSRSQATITRGETLRIPLATEQLVAETQPVQRGTIRLHKSVETTEQRLTVPVTHEDVIIERIPADQYDATALANADETIIPIVEERLVVQKQVVTVEYVRVRKRLVTRDEEVRAPLRREVVTIQEMGTQGGPPDAPLVQNLAYASPSNETKF